MSRGPYLPPRITEPLQWEEVDSPPRYAGTTDNPVQYAAVADRAGTVLGYVWVNDEDDAAGRQYRRAKQQGLAPSAALAKMTREYGPADPSHIDPGSLAEAPSLQTVKDLAAKV